MRISRRLPARWPLPSAAILTFGLVVSAAPSPMAAAEPAAAAKAATSSTLTLTLEECLRLAAERQPRLAAQRASLAAAESGKQAVDALRFPATLIDPEIPVRRKQAAL